MNPSAATNTEFFMDDNAWDDPGSCPECWEKYQWVRPGKSQPNCECHLKCLKCGGKHEYFGSGEHPDHPRVSGYYCRKCGPFA